MPTLIRIKRADTQRLHDINASMSRNGNRLDNALMQSFFSSLKIELLHRTRFIARREARAVSLASA